jgi:hypothetical protein
MKSTFALAFAAVLLPALAFADYSVRPMDQHWDGSLPAVTEWGDAFVSTREVKVETTSPRTGKGVGWLFLVFDRSTGYYLQQFHYTRKEYEYPGLGTYYTADWFGKHYHVGVTSNRIWAFDFQIPEMARLSILVSSEKAEGLDDAESKAMRWAAEQMVVREQTPVHKIQPQARAMNLIFPLGKHVDPANEGLEFVPETLVSLRWRDGRWELTFDGSPTRDKFYHPEARIHLRARFTMDSMTFSSNRYTCVGAESEEITCP